MLVGIEQKMTNQRSLIEYKEFALSPTGIRNKPQRSIDFIIPGILAMTVIQLGIFTAIPIINMREKEFSNVSAQRPCHVPISFQPDHYPADNLCNSDALHSLPGSTLYGFRVAGSYPELIGLVISRTHLRLHRRGSILRRKTQRAAFHLCNWLISP